MNKTMPDKANVKTLGRNVVKTGVKVGVMLTCGLTVGMTTVAQGINTLALVPAIVCKTLSDLDEKL